MEIWPALLARIWNVERDVKYLNKSLKLLRLFHSPFIGATTFEPISLGFSAILENEKFKMAGF